KEIIQELDARGILHSIASKNNFEDAMAKLKEFKLDQYFLYPQIHWNPKSISIGRIQESLNIGIDTLLFIDDQPFERDEVANSFPQVETLDAVEYRDLLERKRLNPRFITKDSKRRRMMYLEEMERNIEEEEYQGPKEEFLASLDMKFVITEAVEEDLKRAEELTVRTNQLNATGRTYDYDELKAFMHSNHHKLFVCELTDRYGSYGKIGLSLIEETDKHWHLKLLLMSCRVMSRSVGSVLLSFIMKEARKSGKKLLADFKQTDRNKRMYAAYRFANFKELSNDGNGNIVMESDLTMIQDFPHYIDISHPEFKPA
ncbi:MAG: HAD-IIIC family phosphatase, partial [Bacteroidota bacterium]